MKEHTMTNEQNIKDLHEAALKVGTSLIAGIPLHCVDYVEKSIRLGCRLTMELGPLPDVRRVDLVIIEPEGRRIIVASQTWEVADLH